MLKPSEPQIISRGPYLVVGAYCTYEGDDEGPGWSGAYAALTRCLHEVEHRPDDCMLGFLYRPHRDHPEVPESVRACFLGVEVSSLEHLPAGLASTRFSGGQYAVVASQGDTQDEASMGVGEGVERLARWIVEQGYVEGDACFACGRQGTETPPFVEYVYMKIERPC